MRGVPCKGAEGQSDKLQPCAVVLGLQYRFREDDSKWSCVHWRREFSTVGSSVVMKVLLESFQNSMERCNTALRGKSAAPRSCITSLIRVDLLALESSSDSATCRSLCHQCKACQWCRRLANCQVAVLTRGGEDDLTFVSASSIVQHQTGLW